MEFSNKTVIVTGAAVGIGKAAALEFAKNGANVVIADIDNEKLTEAEKQISALGTKVSSYICDISDEKCVNALVDSVIKEYGKIDVLVNNAAIWRVHGEFSEMDMSLCRKMTDVNIMGTLYFTQAVLKNMLENKYGRIINIGSVAGKYGICNMTAYAMTKGAVSAFTKSLAKEVAPYGITVNNVIPGNVKDEGSDKDNTELSYMNRSGNLCEFAYLICFLASDKASYISGQDYQIDGVRKKI